MKEQNKTPEKELNKMEKSNLLDAVFKTMVMRLSLIHISEPSPTQSQRMVTWDALVIT